MSKLFYNKETDTAFRIENEWSGKSWCVEVSQTYGRAKMHGHARTWPMPTEELNRQIAAKVIHRLTDAKNMARDIACIKAGVAIPAKDKLSGRMVQTEHVFHVGSLIDAKPEDYQAICCAMTGKVIGHKRNGELNLIKEEPTEEVTDIKDSNQLSFF